MRLVNWELLANPYNWLVVWAMLVFVLLAVPIIRPVSAGIRGEF